MNRIVTFLFVLFITGSAASLEQFEKAELTIVTKQGTQTFQIEIARTRAQHAQGLMFRRKMPPDAGMLFLYDKRQPASFWMKNTFIPLDMLFIGPDGRIVNIQHRTVPHSLTPVRSRGDVMAVLELNGGTTARMHIKAGDEVRHAIFKN